MKHGWISMLVSVVLVIGLAVLPAPKSVHAAMCTSTGTGNWSVAGTWNCGHVPVNGDDVTVATGHTVTVDTDTTSLSSLTVNSGATLTSNAGRTIYVSGNWTNSGTFTHNNGTVTFNGTTTVQGSNTTSFNSVTISGVLTGHSTNMNVAGDWTNNGTFTHNNGTVTFNRNDNQTISGTSSTAFNNITLNMGTSNANVLDIQSVISMASDGLTLTNGTFKLSSASTITPFSGSTTIGSTAGFYLNHTSAVSNWGTTGSLTVNGSLAITAGTMTIGADTGNSLTINGATTNVQISGGTLNITGRWKQVNGGSTNTMNITGGTINVSTAGQTSHGSEATFQVLGDNNFSMSNGTVVIQNANSGAGGDLKITNSNASVTGGTFVIGKGGSTSGNIQIRSDAPLFHMTIDAGSTTPALAASLTLNGNLTLTSGTLSAGSYNISLKGNWTNNSTFTAGTGTVTFNGSGAQAISGATTFYNLTIANTATTPGDDTDVDSDAAVTVQNDLSVNDGQFQPHTGSTFKNVTIAAGGILKPDSGGSLSVSGDFTNGGTFTHNSGTVTFNKNGDQNLAANVATTFYNLTVNSGATLVETAAANNVTVANTLTNNGTIRKSQSIGGIDSYTFGLAGGPINSANLSISVTTDNFTSIQVDRKDSNHSNATTPLQTGYYWTLTPDGSGTVNLTLPVTFTTDTNDRICRYTGSGQVWDCGYSSHTANSITRDGVTTFSDWAAGDNVGPTAVTLSSFTAHPIASQATFFRWQWLALAGAVVAFGGVAVARGSLRR